MIRVLLDEDVDVRLRHAFGPGTQVETVVFQGWKGKKNGDLLRAAARDFDVLVTLDRNLPHQQNVASYDLAVVVLRPETQSLEHLSALVPQLESLLPSLEAGDMVEVPAPPSSGS